MCVYVCEGGVMNLHIRVLAVVVHDPEVAPAPSQMSFIACDIPPRTGQNVMLMTEI